MESKTSGKNLGFRVVDSSDNTLTPLQVYANGVVNVGNNANVNKILVLQEMAASDAPSSATNFYGLGVNTAGSGVLRYQVPATTNLHRFMLGGTTGYTISSSGGANGSDARFKSDVLPIENALDKISKLEGKTFRMHDNVSRDMGFIAQEVLPVVPEVVVTDENDENRFLFLKYDKLTALLCEGIKELAKKVESLEANVAALQSASEVV